MKRLTKTDVPPDGFRWRCPRDGWVSHAWDKMTWVAQAHDHFRSMGYDIPIDLAAQMEDQLCSTLPAGWCDEFDPSRVMPLTHLTRGDVIEGMKVFGHWFARGRRYVSQVEADRRAQICANCYLNVNIQGCSSCHEIANVLAGKRSTPFDSQLHACGVCKCLLSAKVHFPLEVLETTDSPWKQANYPVDFCWLNRKSPSYHPSRSGTDIV